MHNYNYYYSRLFDVFEVQGREHETERCFDNLINDYGFDKACEMVMKIYNQYFD